MDPVFMLKSIVAQRLFGKADKDFELEMFQNSVLQDWLGINYPSDVPSHKTIWKYKEIFAQTEVLESPNFRHPNQLYVGWLRNLESPRETTTSKR